MKLFVSQRRVSLKLFPSVGHDQDQRESVQHNVVPLSNHRSRPGYSLHPKLLRVHDQLRNCGTDCYYASV